MPPRHMLRTKVRRFMVISIEMQALPARARCARRRRSCCPREACAADRPAGTSTTSSRIRGSIRCARSTRRAMVRASSARFSSESGSAHSCVLSPNPLGACGDQSGWRSCRSTGIVVVADLVRVERAKHGHQPVLRRAELPRAFAPRLGQIDERGRHGAKIPVAVAKHAGDAIDRRRGRLVAHEMRDELRREESRGRRVTHERANHALALFDARFAVSHAEHGFRSRLVQQLLKRESDAAVASACAAMAAAAAPCGVICCRGPRARPPTVHPVRIFASSCTSCCV